MSEQKDIPYYEGQINRLEKDKIEINDYLTQCDAALRKLYDVLNPIRALTVCLENEQHRLTELIAMNNSSIFSIQENTNFWIGRIQAMVSSDQIPVLNDRLMLDDLSSSSTRSALINELNEYTLTLTESAKTIDKYRDGCGDALNQVNLAMHDINKSTEGLRNQLAQIESEIQACNNQIFYLNNK
jgi:predicted  nucleic acid-binding Zn-ribbon protein